MEITYSECKSQDIIKRGFRKTQNRGLIQRYFCKGCNKRFVVDDGFFRNRGNRWYSETGLVKRFRSVTKQQLQEFVTKGILVTRNYKGQLEYKLKK